jgi:hypothetical protein
MRGEGEANPRVAERLLMGWPMRGLRKLLMKLLTSYWNSHEADSLELRFPTGQTVGVTN